MTISPKSTINQPDDSTNLKPITISTSTKRAIIFDCDGTLVSNEEVIVLAWQESFKKYNINLTYEELAPCIGDNFYMVKEHFSKKYNIPIPNSIIDKMHELFSLLSPDHVKPIASSIALVKHLSENKEKYNIFVALASGAKKSEILNNLKIAGIEKCFDVIVSGQDDVNAYRTPKGTNKPQPCVYLEAARLLGIGSWQCVAFEDSKSGAEAALQAGMHVFVIPTKITKARFTDAHYGHRITFLASAAEFDINRYLASQVTITKQKAQEHKAI